MTLLERKTALIKLSEYLLSDDDYLKAIIKRSSIHNTWFTEDFQRQAIHAVATDMLDESKLEQWLSAYAIPHVTESAQKVGLVMAGNLPMTNFHDLLCIFVTGHTAIIKLSDKDPYLIPAIIRALEQIDSRTAAYFEVANRLKGFEAIIATGSGQSIQHFKTYFGQYPHIIRQNRNSVAILTGNESAEDLLALGRDIFDYFGLGSRNVSKLYVPINYEFNPLLEALHEYKLLVTHTKYKNNFDYNYALYILNKVALKANGCVMMSENTAIQSPIACLHYEYYDDKEVLEKELLAKRKEIQLVVSQKAFQSIPVSLLGKTQNPTLSDYVDGIDTITFLLEIK